MSDTFYVVLLEKRKPNGFTGGRPQYIDLPDVIVGSDIAMEGPYTPFERGRAYASARLHVEEDADVAYIIDWATGEVMHTYVAQTLEEDYDDFG